MVFGPIGRIGHHGDRPGDGIPRRRFNLGGSRGGGRAHLVRATRFNPGLNIARCYYLFK